ncbi:MAG: iron-sulfur-binding reductase [Deltaproteobacteria bacterium CG03_land_8_20_14_0_80_45_14]|nr:MAG: iron-sulfur-binding reductase [Deltaproteobacteria bacterium CG03_land_8_20_14_0_80_45_14]
MPSREVFWNISYSYVMYILAAIAIAFWVFSIYRRYKLWRLGKPDDCSKNIGKRIQVFIRTTVVDVLAHRRFLRDLYPGMMHLIIFWGFVILLLAAAIDAVTHYTNRHIIGAPYLWFSLIVDIGGLLVLIGIIMAACRRYIWKPKGLNTILDDGIVMALIAVILITGYMVEGLRQAATEINIHPDWAVWSPGGFVLAKAFAGMSRDSLLFWHRFLWWFHSALTIGAIIYVALVFSKLQHIVISPLNVFFRSLGPVGAPAPINIENAETLGVGDIKDFTWKQLLDLDACTNCGRCQDACPAWATGKPLSPRKVVQDLKVHMLKAANNQANQSDNAPTLVGEAPSEAEIWACTTCGACQETCPVYVEHIVKIIDLRRNLVLAQSKMPESAQLMLRNMQSRGHPWAGIQSLRLRGDWTNGLELKLLAEGDNANTLFWVGCTGALVERNVEATLSMTRVLKAAGVEFGVLGDAETCCGDPARRAGYEFQFQIMAEQNIEIFKSHNIKEIITSCPHCYHTIKNEYPRYGGDFKVVHYTQFIADLIRQGKLKLTNELNSKLTYHDPCYLGRYNRVYLEPRRILQAIPKAKLEEMGRSRNTSFCCGGGGGHMWIEEQPGTTKINQMRIEDVLKTGAEMVVTACPYCLQMFEESIEHKDMKDSLKARDLVELVEAAMKQ